jgi:colicin import membrane protein
MTSPLFDTPAPKAAKPAPAAPAETEAVALDLSSIPEAKLELMPRANGVARFAPLVASLPDAEARAASLVISTDDTDDTIALKSADARRLRLDGFRAVRLEAAKVHKELKAGILEIGKELDGAEREIRQRCERTEDALMEIERYAETKAEERRQTLRAARAAQINPFLASALTVDLAAMSEEEFAAALADARELHELREARAKAAEEARVKAEQEAEEKRKADAAAAAAERARLEKEREEERVRLQQEAAAALAKAEEAQARLKAEREAAAAERARLAEEARQIAIERDRVAAAARAAKAKADAEAAAASRAAEEQAAAERRAAAAPDAEKVKALRQRLIDMPLPKMDNLKVFQACDRAVKMATDELARIIAKLEGGAQ